MQLRFHATRGSASSAALGRLEDGAPASRDRLRSFVVSLRGEGERKHWVFVPEDAWFGTAVRAGFRSRGGERERDGACVGSFALTLRGGVPPLRRWGALRTEPPLRVIASAAASRAYYPGNYRVIPTPPRTHDICHVQVMTLCTAPARKPAV